jgi:16S rRNA (guanine966-N2)-methyltransferase
MALRVIAGELKGRRLRTASGLRTRPTAERTREAIFNILGSTVQQAHVLDLFAGNGAYGIEALSRGAASALFIEVDRQACAVLAGNIQTCGMADKARVLRWDASRNLNCLRNHEPGFQLVFMDPPYGRGLVEPALSHLHQSHCATDGAQLVVEHDRDDPLPEPAKPYRLHDQRRYGRTLVSFLTYVL